jgi:hypothetical protein
MQQLLIENSDGISPYLRNFGATAGERGRFLAAIAESAMNQSDSLEGLARRFAAESARIDPGGRGSALLEALE